MGERGYTNILGGIMVKTKQNKTKNTLLTWNLLSSGILE